MFLISFKTFLCYPLIDISWDYGRKAFNSGDCLHFPFDSCASLYLKNFFSLSLFKNLYDITIIIKWKKKKKTFSHIFFFFFIHIFLILSPNVLSSLFFSISKESNLFVHVQHKVIEIYIYSIQYIYKVRVSFTKQQLPLKFLFFKQYFILITLYPPMKL